MLNGFLRLEMKPKRLHEIDPPVLRRWAESRAIPFLPKGVAREWVEAGGARGEWQRPEDLDPQAPTFFYVHGGGYVFGSVRIYRPMTMAIAKRAGAEVFSAEYRLAPEHRCPAALEDALAAYDYVLSAGRRPDRMVIGGDSAGGGLALALLQRLRDTGRQMPAGAVLFSPWADLSASGESIAGNAKSDAMFQRDSIVEGARFYAGDLDLRDPRVSPLFGDMRGLPPLFVLVSRSEMLFDDSRRLAEKALAAGVPVRFEAHDGLAHVWPLFHPFIPEAGSAIDAVSGFVRERAA